MAARYTFSWQETGDSQGNWLAQEKQTYEYKPSTTPHYTHTKKAYSLHPSRSHTFRASNLVFGPSFLNMNGQPQDYQTSGESLKIGSKRQKW